MPSPEASLVVIACPHCGTRYQLAYGAIGAKGRSVACAHCGQSWEARADPPRPAKEPELIELAEEALDEKFAEEERRHREKHAARSLKPPADAAAAAAHQRTLDEIKAAVAVQAAPKPSAHDQKRQQREFSQRQKSLYSTLPQARARRLLRLAALGAMVVVFGGGLFFRNALVTQFPQLAGSYAALGFKINIVGLEFSDLSTVKSLEDGAEVLVVDGKINNIEGHQVSVPPVIVTLTDRAGAPLYEWSMTPRASELEPGEVIALETRLTSPPQAATGVRLSFDTGETQAKPAIAPAISGTDDSAPTDGDTTATTSGGP